MPVFDAPIDIQYRLIAPRGIAGLRRKVVPVVLVPARPSHHIDARSTQNFMALRYSLWVT
jgi:hypothetical protein